MAEYCADSDVEKRLTPTGTEWVADRNQNGAISSTERANNISEAIVWAGTLIDEAIVTEISPTTARASGNLFLKHLCKDLAVWYALTHGGRETPSESVLLAFNRAMKSLDRLASGGLIPGFVYPVPSNVYTISRTPKAVNWHRCCGGNCGTRIRRW